MSRPRDRPSVKILSTLASSNSTLQCVVEARCFATAATHAGDAEPTTTTKTALLSYWFLVVVVYRRSYTTAYDDDCGCRMGGGSWTVHCCCCLRARGLTVLDANADKTTRPRTRRRDDGAENSKALSTKDDKCPSSEHKSEPWAHNHSNKKSSIQYFTLIQYFQVITT